MTRALAYPAALIASLAFGIPSAMAAHTISWEGGNLKVALNAGGGSVDISQCKITGIFVCEGYEISSYQSFAADPGNGCIDVNGDNRRYKCESPMPTKTVVTGTSANDNVSGSCLGGPVIVFNAGGGADTVSGFCPLEAHMGAGDDGASGNGLLQGGDGNDTLTATFASTLQGGAGRDTLIGSDRDDILEGGDDSDRLEGADGNDQLRGGGGRDVLLPGRDTDSVIEGGDGIDAVSYESVSSAGGMSMSLNGAADDGATNEKDNIGADVENVIGSPSPDQVTGNDGINVIETDASNDFVDPGRGNDFVSTGGGDDTISSRDGFVDAIDCGDGNDKVTSDEFDNVANCETNDKSRELMPDIDNDGVPAPADCDDRNPARRPGLPDRPGNKVDEDCSGRDAAFFRIVTGVQSLFRAGSTTQIARLNLVDVPAGATVEVRCKRKKKACFKTKTTKVPKGAAQLDIRKKLKLARVKLRPGSVLEIRITAPDSVGKVVQYPAKRRRIPVSRLRCLPPGAKSPRRC